MIDNKKLIVILQTRRWYGIKYINILAERKNSNIEYLNLNSLNLKVS
jgi:hypothetical protein